MGPLLAAALLLGAGCGRAVRSTIRPNVLIITIDTLRADHVGAYGYGPARTPSLDRLAREGVRCADAVAAAPITLPSHSSLFTGLYPPAHGVRDNGAYALSDRAVTLAERLKAAGYRTQAFVSALVLNRRYNLSQGFDGYDDDLWSEDEPELFMVRDRPAPRTAERAVRWLQGWEKDNRGKESPRKPFFLWVHFYDPHQPYKAPAAELLRSPSPYDAEIAVADQGVGRILAELQRRGQLDDTLVVLTADHGESLGEHGEKTHGIFLYDATVRVPLLLRWPGRLPAGTVYGGPVRSVDLVPTVLAALGLPGGSETQGTDLLPAFRGETAPPALPQYSESLLSEVGFGMAPLYGLRLGGTEWIRAPKPEVYDLKSDPHELRNLYAQEPRLGARLDRELETILEDSRRRALPAAPSPMDRETLETLQALGYLAPRGQREAIAGVVGMDPKEGILLYDKLEDARHLAQRGRWAESETRLREILTVTPRNLTARSILALVRWRQGDPAGARQEYLKVLAEDPRQSRVYAMLGNLALAEGDLAEAERRFREAIGITPGFVEAISNLGMIQALRDDEAGAEAWYRKALAADPGFPRGIRRLADLYYERGEYAKALPLYVRTLEREPGDFAALVQAGNCARRTGDPKAAASYFDQAARLRPDSWVPLYNLACLRAVEGDPQTALALLEKAMAKGFRRVALLEEDEDLKAVRGLPGYPGLLAAVRGKAIRP
ncbi:MAG: choline-sulfatase [Acidobacteriota bacterium]|jgi:arylsulfatase A-like enzyme/Flp pilus assembly protein TadD|nr:choline-sulfatase [Acidobacteriota bacterium]